MSSIMRARSGLTGRGEVSGVIGGHRGSTPELKVAEASMLGIGCPDRHALPRITPKKCTERKQRSPPARAGSFFGALQPAHHRDKKGTIDMKTKNKHQNSGGEVMELARETAKLEQYWIVGDRSEPRRPPKNYNYVEELMHLQIELIKMQECVRHNRLKMCVIFEGRDAAGKGGVIKRITDPLNPRVCRVVALATPTERERGQWYFQRYVAELPSAGEIVLFDRSWYNR